MTIAVQKFHIEVTVQRDSSDVFPFDKPNEQLDVVWPALLSLIKQGARDARVRVGAVDAVFRTPGMEEDHEAGDN